MKSYFPIYDTYPDLIYMDNASTTHKPYDVINAVNTFYETSNANIGRGVYKLAHKAEDQYDAARVIVKNYFGSDPIFVSNATAGFNMIAHSLVYSGILGPGSSIILSVSEHHANIVPRQQLSVLHHFDIKRCRVSISGHIDTEHLYELCDHTVSVVSITGASNVLGVINDISRIKLIVGNRILVVDASQLAVHHPNMYGDIMICTGHKMMGYAGSGVVCMRPNLIKSLTPGVGGGGAIQDVSVSGHTFRTDIQRREAGTPDVGAAISLGAACTFLNSHELIDLDPLIDYLWIQLESIGATILGQPDHRVPLISFVIDGNIVYIAEQLAQHNICVRVGGHCAHPLSHFLGIGPTIRLSLYYYNTMEDCTKFISVLRLILGK